MRDERGFALLSVMLVLVLLSVIVIEFVVETRLEASMVRSYRDGVLAAHLAEAGVQQAIREILGPGTIVALDDDGTLSFYAANAAIAPVKLSRLQRKNVALGAGEFTYRLSDEESRININGAAPDRVDRLLTAVGLDKQVRDVISDTVYRRQKHPFLSPPATLNPEKRLSSFVQDTLRGPVLASIPYFDQKKVVGLLDSLQTMDEGARVANDQVLMLLVSACVLHEGFHLAA